MLHDSFQQINSSQVTRMAWSAAEILQSTTILLGKAPMNEQTQGLSSVMYTYILIL